MLDHDTDSYQKISRAFLDEQPTGHLTRGRILSNITLYWLTGTGVTSARSYWESAQATAPRGRPGSPAGHAPRRLHHLPRRNLPSPRTWVELGYPNVAYYNKAARGGHFAAWEEPELFATENRAAFRSLR